MSLGQGQLFSKSTQAIFFNYKEKPVQRMLDFDYVCGRPTPSVACIVQPGSSGGFQKLFFGTAEVAISIYGTIEEVSLALCAPSPRDQPPMPYPVPTCSHPLSPLPSQAARKHPKADVFINYASFRRQACILYRLHVLHGPATPLSPHAHAHGPANPLSPHAHAHGPANPLSPHAVPPSPPWRP